jgi:hypothetical protein
MQDSMRRYLPASFHVGAMFRHISWLLLMGHDENQLCWQPVLDEQTTFQKRTKTHQAGRLR